MGFHSQCPRSLDTKHHKGVASASSGGSPWNQAGWCLPTSSDILESTIQQSATRRSTNETIHRHGRTRRELHAGGDLADWEFELEPNGRRRLDPGTRSPGQMTLAPTQSLLEEYFRQFRDEGDHAAQQRSRPCALRAAPRRRHEVGTREAELSAHDRSDGAADAEERRGIRPRSSRSVAKTREG
jgi:hypothetical protein